MHLNYDDRIYGEEEAPKFRASVRKGEPHFFSSKGFFYNKIYATDKTFCPLRGVTSVLERFNFISRRYIR